jgi:putative flavoprotein involved in K+ transport
VILDGGARIGDSWRRRWDSLRLFTPAKYDGLPGWRFPASAWSFPTKDEMGDYLEAYADRFDLPSRTGTVVDGLSRVGDRLAVRAGDHVFEADAVVVASGAHRVPKVPAFASQLDPAIRQMHSSEYCNPAQLRGGGVLVVGVGNSGAEIALEASRSHHVWLSGSPVGEIPVRHGGAGARVFLPVLRFAGQHVLTVGTPVGRKVRPSFVSRATPLVRTKMKDLAAAGVEQVPRTAEVRDGRPLLEDGRVLDVTNVVWSTGFRPEYSWIDLPVFGGDGLPMHRRGVVESEPGLYFVGLPFQYGATSDTLVGVGRDARYIAKRIASFPSARARATEPALAAGTGRAVA